MSASVTKTTGANGSVTKDGVYQYSIPYYVKTASEVLTVQKDTYQLSAGSSGVLLKEVSRTWQALNNPNPNTGYIVTVVYEGGGATSRLGTSKDTDTLFDVDFQTLELPIESHWNFEEIKKKYGGYQDPNDSTRWIFADYEVGKENGGKLSPMRGVRTYMVLHCTVEKKYSSKSLPGGALSDVGKWTTNIPGFNKSLINTDGRNWLKMPTQATLRGGVWQITEAWKLSEKDVWPEEVYQQG
jgi:hypothetical protein